MKTFLNLFKIDNKYSNESIHLKITENGVVEKINNNEISSETSKCKGNSAEDS